MNYIELLQSTQIDNIAPYWKRFLSNLFDLAIMYGFYWFIVFGSHNQVPYVRTMTFVFGILHFYWFYSKMNRTIGSMIMKVKPIFLEEVPDINKRYLYKAILKSALFVPISFLYVPLYLAVLIGSLAMMKNDFIRKNKVLLWDFLTSTVVVNDDKENSKL
jgi:hypothetical protein